MPFVWMRILDERTKSFKLQYTTVMSSKKVYSSHFFVLCVIGFGAIFLIGLMSLPFLAVSPASSKKTQSGTTRISGQPLFSAQLVLQRNGITYVPSDSKFLQSDAPARLGTEELPYSVVEVFQKGVTWGEFLSSLPWELSPELSFMSNPNNPSITYYIDDIPVSGLLEKPIGAGDVVRIELGEK